MKAIGCSRTWLYREDPKLRPRFTRDGLRLYDPRVVDAYAARRDARRAAKR
jgi:hypothetical protein